MEPKAMRRHGQLSVAYTDAPPCHFTLYSLLTELAIALGVPTLLRYCSTLYISSTTVTNALD